MLTFLAPPRPWKGGFLRDAAAEGRLPRAFPFPSAGPLSLLSRLADLDATNRTGIALVFPDTSPRGAGIEGEDKDWDFGAARLLAT